MKQAVCLTVAFAATSSGAPGYGPAAGEPTGRASRLPRDPLQNPVMTDDRRWGDVRHASEHERGQMKRWKARAGAHLRGRAESESCCTPGGRPTVTVWAETIARRLRAFHLDSIRNQMLVFAVVATILPALALTMASSRQDRRSIVDQIAQELRGTSAAAAWEIDQWLSDRLRDLRVAATAYAVAENLVRAQANAEAVGRLREDLNSVRERCSDCEALLVVEGHGRFVASSGGRMTGVQFSQDRLSSLRTRDALVGDPYWDTGLGKAAIGLALPIRQPDGRYVGALMAKLNLRAVADLLQRLAPRAAAGGGLYVVTDQGRLILKSRGRSADLMRTKLPMAQELLDREGSTVEYRRADGQNVIGTLRRGGPPPPAAGGGGGGEGGGGGRGGGAGVGAPRLRRPRGGGLGRPPLDSRLP